MARPRKKTAKVRKDGNFEAKVTIGKDMNGKPIRKSFYSSVSVADAKRKGEEHRIQREIDARSGVLLVDKKMTFGEWAEVWLETYKKPHVTKGTFELTYIFPLRSHVLPHFGNADMMEIRNADIQAFISKKSHLSESSLKKMILAMSQIFDAAIDNDLCYKNPCKKIKIRSEYESEARRHYNDEEIKIVCEHTRMPEIIVMLKTGLRRGEILGLMWSDIDFDECTISVRRSVANVPNKGEQLTEILPPKKNSYRTIPISADLAKIISRIQKKSMYIFPDMSGNIYNPNSWSSKFRREMKRLYEVTGVRPLRAHELRHTAGTALSRHGVDVFTIQKILGHKDIMMTTNLYVHDEVERLRSAMQKANVI